MMMMMKHIVKPGGRIVFVGLFSVFLETEGTRQRGHPKKPWWDCVKGIRRILR